MLAKAGFAGKNISPNQEWTASNALPLPGNGDQVGGAGIGG